VSGPTGKRRHIFCAGFGWEFKGEPFRSFVDTRQDQVLKRAQKGHDTICEIYDVGKGLVQTTELTWQGGQSSKSVRTEQRYQPVTSRAYVKDSDGELRFRDNQSKIMSVVDIYKRVISIGKTEPASIHELSIFSHAFFDGPILVNSFDDGYVTVGSAGSTRRVRLPVGLRDPDDKDGRSNKDFVTPNLPAEDLALFHGAFAPTGYAWVWGCNFPRDLNVVLRLVERNSRYTPGIADDVVLEFRQLTREQIDSFVQFKEDLEIETATLLKTHRCSVPFRLIKRAMWAGVTGSYAYQMAYNVKLKVMGALYGTYAEFFAGSPKLMAISSKTRSHVEFYKKHFGVKTDDEGRNYGVFDLR
jgi:hypothetical protein